MDSKLYKEGWMGELGKCVFSSSSSSTSSHYLISKSTFRAPPIAPRYPESFLFLPLSQITNDTMASSTHPRPTTLVLGATGGCALAFLVRALNAGYDCSARTSSFLQSHQQHTNTLQWSARPPNSWASSTPKASPPPPSPATSLSTPVTPKTPPRSHPPSSSATGPST